MINKISIIEEETTILISLIKSQEKSLSEFISNFEEKIQVEYEEGFQQNYAGDEGELVQFPVEHYAGIDDRSYDVREIFKVVLPMYQRQAMLITIWSHIDNSLYLMTNYLVDEIHKKIGKKKGSSDFYHRIKFIIDNVGSEFTVDFFDSVKSLDTNVRIVRNKWVHNGGRIDKDFDLEKIGLKEKYSQISITSEYLNKTLVMMDKVICDLVKAINKI